MSQKPDELTAFGRFMEQWREIVAATHRRGLITLTN